MRVVYQSLVLINEDIVAELIGPCYFYHKKLFAMISADEIQKETQSGNCFRFKEKAKWQPQTLLILNRIKIIMEMNSFEDSPAYSRNAIG